MEEQALLRELQAGSQDAFRKLFRNYRQRVYNTCLGLLQHSEDAEDVTQEVFIEVFRSSTSFRGDAQLSTWLYRVATNKSLDHLRAQARGKRSGNVVRLDGEAAPQIAAEHAFVHPGVALEQKERAKTLFAAIAALPENQRVAFTLSKVEGLSYKEIGEVMEMNLPAIESLIHRAKTNLKKLLADFYRAEK